MKMSELHNKEVPYKVYCDLDGVLVAFDEWAFENLGHSPYEWDLNRKVKNQFWRDVDTWVASGKPFFEAMDPKADADVLWSYIEKYNPTILSATGHVNTAIQEKRAWVKKHLGYKFALTAVLVPKAIDKAQYATPTSILIDDRAKAINPWIAAGGIGILHTSAVSTIEQLKQLGL
jgi:hypothetical protein